MNPNSLYSLPQAVDLYYADAEIGKKKYFKPTLITARFVWKEIFKNTLWEVQSVWKTVQEGDPYPYVEVPANADRIFSVSVEDDCHNLTPLFYNNRINVVSKPTVKKCGCTSCECGGLCKDVNALTYTTKVLFTINGVDYIEKTYTEVCGNGDVLVWTETPVKKYNDLTGDGGDFNTDFNDDYDIAAAPFSDYEIVYVKTQKKICHLETLPCGCPKDTPENEQIFTQFCGCFMAPCNRKRKHCDDFLASPNSNGRGEVKISECGTKIYFKPPDRCHHLHSKRIPDFLLISFQTNGEECNQEVLVPEYALQCLFDGIDYYKKKRKDRYSYNEKLGAKWQFEDSRSKLILHLSPFSLEELSNIQDSRIAW